MTRQTAQMTNYEILYKYTHELELQKEKQESKKICALCEANLRIRMQNLINTSVLKRTTRLGSWATTSEAKASPDPHPTAESHTVTRPRQGRLQRHSEIR